MKLLIVLSLLIPLRALAVDPEELRKAQVQIQKPIMANFAYDSAGSDVGVYDGYRSTPEASLTLKALLTIGGALATNRGDQSLESFVRTHRAKIAYWLARVSSNADQNPQTFKEILVAQGPKTSEIALTFDQIERVLGKVYLRLAFQNVRGGSDPRLMNDQFFDELFVKFNSTTNVLIEGVRLGATIDYGMFRDAHTKLGVGPHVSDYVRMLIELHKAQSIRLDLVFRSSLWYFVHYNLSHYSGYARSEDVEKGMGWFNEVLRALGEQRFLEIMLDVAMSDSFYPKDGESFEAIKARKLAVYLKKNVGFFEEGILNWILIHGSPTLKKAFLDWVLDLSAKGKDWLKFEISREESYARTSARRDFVSHLRASLQSHVKSEVANSGGRYKNAMDYLIGRGLVSEAEATAVGLWAQDIVNKRATIDLNHTRASTSSLRVAVGVLGFGVTMDVRNDVTRAQALSALALEAERTFPEASFKRVEGLLVLTMDTEILKIRKNHAWGASEAAGTIVSLGFVSSRVSAMQTTGSNGLPGSCEASFVAKPTNGQPTR